ncbi:Pol protein [Phytophthora palmivora]|uniref:Pol protein n=1 Tax=Phytophthora palmivora TaxID=4796 RepID=A0A2P4YGV8_9STRA|nr:Pol protein [Phytophthora palmivora]
MVHLAPVCDKVTGKQAAQLFLDSVFCYHGLPETIVSDRDPRFAEAFWDTLFQLLGTKMTMSPADHPQTDCQTERVNRVLEDTLRSICAEAPRSWSDQPPMVEFALNNAVHASTGLTPFYLNSPSDANLAGRHRGSEFVRLDLRGLVLRLLLSVGVNQWKQRVIRTFAVLDRHGATCTIGLPASAPSRPLSVVDCLKWFHEPKGTAPPMKEDPDENSPPQIELSLVDNQNRRASGRAPHGLELLSTDGFPSQQSCRRGATQLRHVIPLVELVPAHGRVRDQQRLACQPKRQLDYHIAAQGLSRSCKHDPDVDRRRHSPEG